MRYRKIDPRIWNDEKFNSLSDNGKLVFFFLLTHPHMTPVGAMRGTMGGFAEELGWKTKAFREAFQEAFSQGMVKHNQKAHFVSLPNFMKYNPPESPNVVTAWAKCMDDIPECSEKSQLYYDLKALLEDYKEAFREAFAKAFVKPTLKTMPNQEQEQEQDIYPPVVPPSPEKPKKTRAKPRTPPPKDFKPTKEQIQWAKDRGFNGDIQMETEKFLTHWGKTDQRWSDWNQAWRNWILKAIEYKRERAGGSGNSGGMNATEAGMICRDCKQPSDYLEDGLCEICREGYAKVGQAVASGGKGGSRKQK